MAVGIGQQIKGVVQRARSYWADLTDSSGRRAQSEREEKEDAVHQRYGGVSSEPGRDAAQPLSERQAASGDRGIPDAPMGNPSTRAARGQASSQAGGQTRRSSPAQAGQMQAGQANAPSQAQGASQTSRQYTQQGGSGIQKSLGEQLGGDSSPAAPGATRGRGSGQRQ